MLLLNLICAPFSRYLYEYSCLVFRLVIFPLSLSHSTLIRCNTELSCAGLRLGGWRTVTNLLVGRRPLKLHVLMSPHYKIPNNGRTRNGLTIFPFPPSRGDDPCGFMAFPTAQHTAAQDVHVHATLPSSCREAKRSTIQNFALKSKEMMRSRLRKKKFAHRKALLGPEPDSDTSLNITARTRSALTSLSLFQLVACCAHRARPGSQSAGFPLRNAHVFIRAKGARSLSVRAEVPVVALARPPALTHEGHSNAGVSVSPSRALKEGRFEQRPATQAKAQINS